MTALFLTAAMAAAVAGCSQETTEVKDTSAAAVSSEAKQEEGTESVCGWQGEPGCRGEGEDFLFIAFFTNPELPRAKYYMEKLEEFRAANPDIEVEDVSIADAESYKSSLKASVAAGSPPTLFYLFRRIPTLRLGEKRCHQGSDAHDRIC